MRTYWITASVLTLGTLIASGAYAQARPEGDAEVDEVVVTGSRLSQTAITSPVPVMAVTSEALKQAGTENVADVLTELGSIGVGRTDTNSQNNYALAAMNLVDLRKLGFNRTLTLVNGRRQVAGDIFSNAVDLNSVPAPLVERIEVVTGGTSAIYGADAVSGVINVILKKDFEGFEARVRGGVSSRGDAESFGASFTGGQNFADARGNITVNLVYDTQEGVKATARDYAVNGLNWIVNPANTASNDGVPNQILRERIRFLGPPTQSGFIDFGGGAFFTVNPDGNSVRPFDFGEIGNQAGRSIGGDNGFFEKYDNLAQPYERMGISTNFSYQVADNVRFFAEGRYITTHVESRWQPTADFEYGPPILMTTNPFVPANLRAILTAANAPAFAFYRVYEDFGRRGSDSDRSTLQFTAGFDGKVFDRFNYEVFAGYGRTKLETLLVDGRDQDRFLESVNVALVNGVPACADAAARARGCAPLNVFNPASTPAGIAYSRVSDPYNARNTLKMAGANLTGDLFTLPAGPVAFAVGVEARQTIAETMPSVATQRGRIQMLFEGPIYGKIDVKEAFGEVRAPLLKDLPMVHELTLQAAGRVSDYSTSGTTETWNLGGVYSPVPSLRLRMMRSQSVRAPNVTELFSPQIQGFQNLTDPCNAPTINDNANRLNNCRALGVPVGFVATTGSKPVFGGGNRSLTPETADTWTVGVTFAPDFIPGFSATVDWFDIDISDAIGAIPAQTVLNNCVDLAVAPADNPLCGAIVRDAASRQLVSVSGKALNVGALKTSGVDFSLNYGFRLDQYVSLPGRAHLSVNGTWLDKLRQLTDANNPASENQIEDMLGVPEWEVSTSATYQLDRMAVTWRTHYLASTFVYPSILLSAPPVPDNLEKPRTGSKIYHDLSVSYDLTEGTNLRVNVNNIFDNKPPKRGNNIHQGLNNASIYPNLGTMLSAVLTHRF